MTRIRAPDVLPSEHAAALTRAAGPNNLAHTAAYFPVFAGVEAEVVACFKNGGGVPYSSYARFHEVMNEAASATFDATLIDRVLPIVPGLIERLDAGIAVADVGCGSGHAINLMANAFPSSDFVGYDLAEEPLLARHGKPTSSDSPTPASRSRTPRHSTPRTPSS